MQPCPHSGMEGETRRDGEQPLPITLVLCAGFTGFVPRARFLIGAGFPITTHRALLEFARMSRKDGSKPRAMGTSSLLPPLGRTYPAAGGLLPNYTGYIPGEHLAAWGRDPPGPIPHLQWAPTGFSLAGLFPQTLELSNLGLAIASVSSCNPMLSLTSPMQRGCSLGKGQSNPAVLQPRGLSPAVTPGTAPCHRLQASASSPPRAQLTAPSSGP